MWLSNRYVMPRDCCQIGITFTTAPGGGQFAEAFYRAIYSR
jgi:hypothetical protein